jgi:polysaccharide biosynthesis transport protein
MSIVDLDLRQLMRIARRWWWLALLTTLLAGTSAYYIVSRQQPLYSASATLLVSGGGQSPGMTDYNSVYANQALADTYSRLVTSQQVIDATIADLGLNETPKDWSISAAAEADAPLLIISVSDTVAERATLIANTVAEKFSTYVANQRTQLTSVSRDALARQIENIQAQLDATQAQQQALQSSDTATTAATQSQIASLQTTYNLLQQSQSDLLLRLQDLDIQEATARATVIVADPAQVPDGPYAPNVQQQVILASFVGLMIGIGAIFLLEYLDNTVKGNVDFSEKYGLPLLTSIDHIAKLRPGHNQLFVDTQPRSMPAEAIRLLRTNLEFAAASHEISSLAITSAGPGEGKSTVTANLAVAMAQAGFSTLLVDADLRRPSQHRIWNVMNTQGLSTILTRAEHLARPEVTSLVMPNLTLITSGPLPPNPADLLSLNRFTTFLNAVKEEFDIVLIDTPPVLAVSDPLVVASDVDAMLVVAYAGRTRIEALRHALGMLSQRSVRVVGVVLNQRTGRHTDTYYSYGGYYGADEHAPTTGKSGRKPKNADHVATGVPTS